VRKRGRIIKLARNTLNRPASDLARAFQLGLSRAMLGTIDLRWRGASLRTDGNSDEIFAGDGEKRRDDDNGETRRQNHSARGRWLLDGSA